MKQILLLAFIFCSMSLSAQSLIVTTSGQPITGYDVTVTPNGIFYRVAESSDSQFLMIATDSVSLVRHSNGDIVNLSEKTHSENSPANVISNSNTKEVVSKVNEVRNNEILSIYNTPFDLSSTKFTDSKTKRFLVCEFKASEDSVFANDDIEMICEIGQLHPRWDSKNLYSTKCHYIYHPVHIPILMSAPHYQVVTGMVVYVHNKSNKTMYIDLGNTFFRDNNDMSFAYYTPSATSTTNSKTRGTSVNLGSVANAAGVGGALGALAGGINVGGANSKTTTDITYSQRVISIPPSSKIALDVIELFDLKSIQECLDLVKDNLKDMPNCGSYEWNISNSWLKWGVYMTYSHDESMSEVDNLFANFHIGNGTVVYAKFPLLSGSHRLIIGANKQQKKENIGKQTVNIMAFPYNESK